MTLIHKEFFIQGKNKSAEVLVQVISDFCAASTDYTFLTRESEEYQRGINAVACMVADTSSAVYPALAFASSNDAKLHLTNIVPKHVSQIFIKEYNEIANRFTDCFNQFSRKRKLGVCIVTTSGELALESAIPGKKTREIFNRYLALHPTSYHRCDIDRLDNFICAAFRYCRKNVDVHMLRRYLVEVLKWGEKDANWCCDRIETGLEILSIDRKFY